MVVGAQAGQQSRQELLVETRAGDGMCAVRVRSWEVPRLVAWVVVRVSEIWAGAVEQKRKKGSLMMRWQWRGVTVETAYSSPRRKISARNFELWVENEGVKRSCADCLFRNLERRPNWKVDLMLCGFIGMGNGNRGISGGLESRVGVGT